MMQYTKDSNICQLVIRRTVESIGLERENVLRKKHDDRPD